MIKIVNKAQGGKWIFVMFYVFFLSFVVFMISLPDSPITNVVMTSTNSTISPPVCSIGIFAIIDVVVCAINYIVYFFQFMAVSVAEGYGWLWTLLFLPFIVTLAWVIAEFIRGND